MCRYNEKLPAQNQSCLHICRCAGLPTKGNLLPLVGFVPNQQIYLGHHVAHRQIQIKYWLQDQCPGPPHVGNL